MIERGVILGETDTKEVLDLRSGGRDSSQIIIPQKEIRAQK